VQALSAFFYNNGTGVSLEDIHNTRYRQLVSIPLFYDMNADQLMMEVHRAIQQQMRDGAVGGRKMSRSKSVYQQRNLGTIKQRKKDKRQDKDGANPEIMMRILRMRCEELFFAHARAPSLGIFPGSFYFRVLVQRPGTGDFLSQQLQTLQTLQHEQQKMASPLFFALPRSRHL
jgi:hypothetical protein